MPRNFDLWIQEWEEAVTDAADKGVEEVKDMDLLTSDLEDALNEVLNGWMSTYRQINKQKIGDGSLSFREVGAELREYALKHSKPTGPRVARGAFAATYGKQDAEEEAESEAEPADEGEDKQSTSQRKGARGGKGPRGNRGRGYGQRNIPKRKRAETETNPNGATCKACLGFHDISECWYVIDGKAVEGWIPNETIKRLVADRVKESNELAEIIKRLNRKVPPKKTE
ncbi:hypothetical protein F4804DRAFT_217350 [Jackrogersella minutella]|nr:hypothetical protein F4804DRAFT_217350 [Jackrogersella minutella]